MTVDIDVHGKSDRGRIREQNADQYLIADLSRSMLVRDTSLRVEDRTRLFGESHGQILVVADGMGGHAAGEVASAVATRTLMQYLLNTASWFFLLRAGHEEDFRDELHDILLACQSRLERLAEEDADLAGMGTTLTLACLLWPRLFIVHVGDSRAYLKRGDTFEQITTDHTLGQLAEQAIGTDGPSDTHRGRGALLWNAIGGDTTAPRPEVYKVSLAEDDTLLLCTDGLTRHLSDPGMREILASSGSAEKACHALVDAANDAGGEDNVTAIVAHFPAAQATEAAAVAAG